jgi:hypothetical protein
MLRKDRLERRTSGIIIILMIAGKKDKKKFEKERKLSVMIDCHVLIKENE